MSRSATFLQKGNVLDIKVGAAYSAGDVVALGVNAIGVALTDIASGATGPVKVDGVYEMPAIATAAFTVGLRLFWDDTNKVLTNVAKDMVAAGICVEAKAEAGAVAKIKLTQGLGVAQTIT